MNTVFIEMLLGLGFGLFGAFNNIPKRQFYILLALMICAVMVGEVKAGPFIGGGMGYTSVTNADPRCNEFCPRDDLLGTAYIGYRWHLIENHKGMLTHEIRGVHDSGALVEDKGYDRAYWTVEWEWGR